LRPGNRRSIDLTARSNTSLLRELRELVGMPEEVLRRHAVMAHQAGEGGAVAVPVVLAQAVGFVSIDTHVPRYVVRHGLVDVRKDVGAGVMQRIV
jgi:hypothetical protein